MAFVFVTNGRPYVKQLATKSGIWFWDARTSAPPRALAEWFSPRDLVERLEQDVDERAASLAEREIGVTGLRPYQEDAVRAVEDAVARGQRQILLALATGTARRVWRSRSCTNFSGQNAFAASFFLSIATHSAVKRWMQ